MCRKVEVLFLVIVVEVYCVLVELAAAGPCEYLTHLPDNHRTILADEEERIHIFLGFCLCLFVFGVEPKSKQPIKSTFISSHVL